MSAPKSLTSLLIHPRAVLAVTAVFYLAGLAGISYPPTRLMFLNLMPFSLIFSFLVILLFHSGFKGGFPVFCLAIFILSILLETAGVKTAVIFGKYSYGNSLGFKVFDVPLLIGINWVMLIYCCIATAGMFKVAGQFQLLIAAVFMVIYDVAMEPVAPLMDMWTWAGGKAPLQNYIAWFVSALIFITLSKSLFINLRNKVATGMLVIQFAFFLMLNVTLRMFPL